MEYLALQRLGRMRESDDLTQERLDEYLNILQSLPIAETPDEVKLILDTFPEKDEGFYGLDWSMLHILEESPIYLEVFTNYRPDSEWTQLIDQRIKNYPGDFFAVQAAKTALDIPNIWLASGFISEQEIINLHNEFKDTNHSAEYFRLRYFLANVEMSDDLRIYLHIANQETDEAIKREMLLEVINHGDFSEELASYISNSEDPAVIKKLADRFK